MEECLSTLVFWVIPVRFCDWKTACSTWVCSIGIQMWLHLTLFWRHSDMGGDLWCYLIHSIHSPDYHLTDADDIDTFHSLMGPLRYGSRCHYVVWSHDFDMTVDSMQILTDCCAFIILTFDFILFGGGRPFCLILGWPRTFCVILHYGDILTLLPHNAPPQRCLYTLMIQNSLDSLPDSATDYLIVTVTDRYLDDKFDIHSLRRWLLDTTPRVTFLPIRSRSILAASFVATL